MKARMVCLCALVCFVPMFVRVYGQSSEEATEPVINLGLAEVDEIYVRVVADKVTEKRLEDEIRNRLSLNGLKVVPADVNELDEQQKRRMAELLKGRGGPTQNLKVYLSDVPELIVRISVQFHNAHIDERIISMGPYFGQVKGVVGRLIRVRLGHDLNAESPFREIAIFDGVEKIFLCGLTGPAHDFCGLRVGPVLMALHGLEMKLHPEPFVLRVDKTIGVTSVAINVTNTDGQSAI